MTIGRTINRTDEFCRRFDDDFELNEVRRKSKPKLFLAYDRLTETRRKT